MSDAESFDRAYAVSDLHIGGRQGFQIFSGRTAFPGFLRLIAAHESGRTALVINGDFIDFLAEEGAAYFDAEGAPDKLRRIAADPTFADSFSALGEFVKRTNNFLIINLGNHDLELALSAVQEAFLDRVCGSDHAARYRVRFVTDGTGVRFDVGGRSVLCVHGNEVDDWNVVDFDTLRRIRLGISRGYFDDDANPRYWLPNGGTKLVIDAMNHIKLTHPFVDVLKPERQAAIKTLLALDPGVLKHLDDFGDAFAKKLSTSVRRLFGLLTVEESEAVQIPPGSEFDRTALMRNAESNLKSLSPGHAPSEQTLGIPMAIWNAITFKGTVESLREALESVDDNSDFNIFSADADNRKLAAEFGSATDLLISGHTHFARSLPMISGHHFNAGTWAYLMQLKPEVRGDKTRFAEWIERLKNSGLDALDQGELLIKRHTVVCVSHADNEVCAELAEVAVTENVFRLEPIALSRRTFNRK